MSSYIFISNCVFISLRESHSNLSLAKHNIDVNVKTQKGITKLAKEKLMDRTSSCYFLYVSLVLIFQCYIHHYILSVCSSCPLPFFDVHFISLLFSYPLTSLYFPLSVPSALISIPIVPLCPTLSFFPSLDNNGTRPD